MIKLIGLDLDGTLAKTLEYYFESKKQFSDLIRRHGGTEEQVAAIEANMLALEKKNATLSGVGPSLYLKVYTDAALEYAPDVVSTSLLRGIRDNVETLRNYPAPLFDDAADFIQRLKGMNARAIIITKGQHHRQLDSVRLLDAAVGGSFLASAHVLVEKSPQDYDRVLRAEGVKPEEFVMVGDSVGADVNPVLALGGHAIHISRPASLGWAFESAQIAPGGLRAASLREVGDALEQLIAAQMPKPAALQAPAFKK